MRRPTKMHPKKLDHEELEVVAGNLLGRMIFAYSRLETNLSLTIFNNLSDNQDTAHRDEIVKEIEGTFFNTKLTKLLGAIKRSYPNNKQCYREYTDWKKSVDAVRKLRNDFMHGRWGIHAPEQEIINVTGLPGSKSQNCVRYSIEELEAIVASVHQIDNQLIKLKRKWPI